MPLDQSVGLTTHAAAIDLSADRSFDSPSAIMISGAGSVKVDTVAGEVGVILKMPAYSITPVLVKKVYSTANGTTATDLVRLW